MKSLIFLPVSVLFLAIAGCGKESDELPVDGRDFDGVQYSVPAPYTGKVIDGYLKNARVWLDMDGDSQYTRGPMEFELASGRKITLPSGEPTAMSGEGGQFSLDTLELVVGPTVGPNIDPRKFPLYALAIPGKTLEQTFRGDVQVPRAFLLSAAPGVRNITPLTTLARYRRLAALGPLLNSTDTSLSSLAGINLLKDYVLAEDDRAHAYARAMARFMASQFPDAYNNALAEPGSDGTERFLSRPGAFLLGISLVQNAGDVIAAVDSEAQGNYANIGVDLIDLPEVPVELSDPVLLTSQRVYAQPKQSGELPANRSSLLISAELKFDYSEDGRLQSISVDGCLAPSMQEIARLLSVKGYMAKLSTQWLPSASLSPQSSIAYSNPGIDERLVFDWAAGTATFETGTTCHLLESIQPGSTELGGNPEVTYSWSYSDGELAELVAQIPQQNSTLTRTLIPKLSSAPDGFPGYQLKEDGVEQESLIYSGGLQSCTIEEDAENAAQVVTGFHGYAFWGYEPQPTGFTGLSLEFDTRGELINRPLRYGFLAPEMAGLDNVDAEEGFEWALYYPDRNAETPLGGTPNLIREAYLKSYGSNRSCGRKFEDVPSGVYARVDYTYKNLSEYLVERLR
ncbi:hypothetical protein SAMN04488490_2228 [Marinobacter sp. LV10R510-11A]|uniref:hypothetical protein n=1 Tax=Marinobacter sp. LV10R510-11A TaxID=1415568 RepID=UPI000BB830E9|nr:hypothetical protein [Marinobacter sp. LV10R510-11A]SOB76527.1 hypothetical protein SAMN04488490_2228 [Marinobacter sp. LV10R510-11A]